jgi:iron complex outermembrane receptor protein
MFAKYRNTGRLTGLDELAGHDALGLAHLGGRLDWHRGPRDEATVQGDFYDGTSEERTTTISLDPPYSNIVDFGGRVRGEYLMGSWQRTYSAKSDFRFKAYFDRTIRRGALISENLRSFDVDFQHRLAAGGRHAIMWGGGYRHVDIEIDGSPTAWFDRPDHEIQNENLFVQDVIAVLPHRVTLTLGSKFEHNDFSEFEAEPSARLLWAVGPSHTVWGAVSRAVRIPGPVDENVNSNLSAFPIGGGANGVVRLSGADMQPEIMTAVELGYRAKLNRRLSLDLASFQSRYLHLRSVETGTPFSESDPAPDHMVFPLYFANGFHALTRGLEGTLDWRPGVRFGMTVSHSLFWMRLERNEGTTGDSDAAPGDAPTYQLTVRPHVVVTRHLSLDATWYHVDDLPAQGVPAYDRLDARLGWTPTAGLELSAGVQNVLHDRELEFTSASGTSAATTVRTGAYGKVTWKL